MGQQYSVPDYVCIEDGAQCYVPTNAQKGQSETFQFAIRLLSIIFTLLLMLGLTFCFVKYVEDKERRDRECEIEREKVRELKKRESKLAVEREKQLKKIKAEKRVWAKKNCVQHYHPGSFQKGRVKGIALERWDCCRSKDPNVNGCRYGAPRHHPMRFARPFGTWWWCCKDVDQGADGCEVGLHPHPFPSDALLDSQDELTTEETTREVHEDGDATIVD